MKFTNLALTGAAIGLANAGPVSKRAISDGMLLPNQWTAHSLTFFLFSRHSQLRSYP